MIGSVLLFAIAGGMLQAGVFTPYEPLRFDLTPTEILEDCTNARKRAETDLAHIASLSAPSRTFDNTVWALDRALFDFYDATSGEAFLGEVSVSSSVRDAGHQCEVTISQFTVDLYSREDLAKAIDDFTAKRVTLRGEDARLLDKTLLDFKRSGWGLPAPKRREVRDIRKRLAQLEVDFNRNIAESNDYVLFNKDQLDGLSDGFIAKLARQGDQYKVGVDYPTYFPFMENARRADSRRLLELKFNDRASRTNIPLLQEALALRRKAARLLGYSNHADFAIEPNMARRADSAGAFLSRLRARLKSLSRDERSALLSLKSAMEGPSADKVIHAWDWRYYDHLLRKTKFDVDSELVREYFPTDLVVDQMLDVYQRLLGLKFRVMRSPLTWHPETTLYEITDAAGGELIGYFYTDLFPRDGKYGHAAAFTLVVGRRLTDGRRQRPVSAIVANLDKPSSGRPSLLSHDEVETLFHEFGHIMHQTLSKANYGRFSGSNVARDFMEAPSQMLENWVWDPVVLQSLSGHYRDRTKKLPRELLDKMLAAKNADIGLTTLRQIMFGEIDLDYHSANPPSDTTKAYGRFAEKISLVPMSAGTHPEASFGHLMGGYDAGYYGYLWSKVYAQDMFSVFQAQGVMNPTLGRRYREQILEQGSSRDEADSLQTFLGRPPQEDAFFKSIGL